MQAFKYICHKTRIYPRYASVLCRCVDVECTKPLLSAWPPRRLPAQAGDPSAVRAKCSGWRAASSQASQPSPSSLQSMPSTPGYEPSRILKFHNHREGLPLLLVESTMVGRHEIGADAKVIRNEWFGARKILKAVCL